MPRCSAVLALLPFPPVEDGRGESRHQTRFAGPRRVLPMSPAQYGDGARTARALKENLLGYRFNLYRPLTLGDVKIPVT